LALPGGDPLAAALAAGETPSPEMVAASGIREGLRPCIAWGILALLIAGLIVGIAISDRAALYGRIPVNMPPEALIVRAQEILKKAGYTEGFADSAAGFTENTEFLRWVESSYKTGVRSEKPGPSTVLFWYRQSPQPLALIRYLDFGGRVTPNNP